MWDFQFAINRSIKTILLALSLILLSSCADPEKPPSEESKANNLKPIAVIFPSSEQSVYIGNTLTFKDAGSADPDSNATLTYKWYIADPAIPGSTQIFAITEQSPFTFTQAGVVTMTLIVTDELGLESDPVSVTVIVNPLDANRAPNGNISYTIGDNTQSTSELSVTTGTDVVFTGSATDPDNDPIASLVWSFPTGVTVDETPNSNPFTVSFLETGIYNISLTATDSRGAVDETPAQITVTVTDAPVINQKPIAVISPPMDKTILVGDKILFTGDGSSDPDANSVLSYAWTFETTQNTGVSSTQFIVANPGSIEFLNAGTVVVSLVVTDSAGLASDPAMMTVTVNEAIANQKPIARITPPTATTIVLNDSISFMGNTSSDPDNNTPLSFLWTIAGSATSIRESTLENTGNITFTQVGVVTVTLVVTDSTGIASDPASVTITINSSGLPANQKPIAVMSPSTDKSIMVGDTINFSGVFSSDPDANTVLNYTWTFDTTTTAGLSLTETVNGAVPGNKVFRNAGSVVVSLVVMDSANLASDPVSIIVTVNEPVVNQSPIARITPPTATTINTGDSIAFMGNTSSDPDGNIPLTYVWTFVTSPLDGLPPAPTTSTEINPNVDFPVAGTVDVSLVVTDSLGLASTNAASITITVSDVFINQTPIARITPPTATTISTDDVITFMGNTSSDPDGNVPLTYDWTFVTTPTTGQAPQPMSSTAANPTITFTIAGTVDVSLVVTDSLGLASTNATNITITVSNTLINQQPIARITPPATTTITTVDFISLMGDTSSDPDGNVPLTYAWTFVATPSAVGATPITTTSTEVNPNVNFPDVGTVDVSLVVTDSLLLASQPTSIMLTVIDVPVNLAPSGQITHDQGNGTTGSVGDINIVAGGAVDFDSAVTDPDGDPITYAWTFEGSPPTTANISGPITVSYSVAGTYTVSLTVSDDQNNSNVLTPITVTVMPVFQFLPVLTDEDPAANAATYTINVEENVDVKVASPTGTWTTPMMRYNGLQRSPVIVAKRGDSITINVNNNLVEETTVHWHGFKIPGKQDGGPDFPFAPATSKTYSFNLVQPAASLWFHPHADGFTATQVYKGLAGAFIITDDITDSLESRKLIPSADHDIALLIQDRSFDPDNGTGVRNLTYQAMGGGGGMPTGMLGNRILVNGVETPVLAVDTRKYRFRLYNGSNARTYDFTLSNNADFYVVATDGGLLNVPVLTKNVVLSAGERVEIVVDFGTLIGQQVMLMSSGGMMGGGAPANVMRFDVNIAAADPVENLYISLDDPLLPSKPEILTRLTEAQGLGSISKFDMRWVNADPNIPGDTGKFLINGLPFDINFVNERFTLGNQGITVIWEISNASGMMSMPHPFHAHAIQWQILDRGPTGGNLLPATGVDLGWVDTVLVQPGETVRFIGFFDPAVNSGKYMYHCHILEHEDAGMMGTFVLE